MADDESTEVLFRRVAMGDIAAFDRVSNRTLPRVLMVAHGVLRNYALAEEVAQEVMVEIWRTAPAFDPGRAEDWIRTGCIGLVPVAHSKARTRRPARLITST